MMPIFTTIYLYIYLQVNGGPKFITRDHLYNFTSASSVMTVKALKMGRDSSFGFDATWTGGYNVK